MTNYNAENTDNHVMMNDINSMKFGVHLIWCISCKIQEQLKKLTCGIAFFNP